ITTEAFGPAPALAVHPSTRLDGRDYAVGDGVVWVSGPARVPVRIDGWIRTADSSFLLRGLRAELTRYVPSAPNWKSPHEPVVEPITSVPSTENGVPRWNPPPAVRQ